MYKYIIKSHNFIKDFNYYFDLFNNIIIIVFKFRFFLFRLPSVFFFKKDRCSYSFIVLYKFIYLTFLKHLYNFYNRLFSFYYFSLKLKGLGYRVFIVSKFLIKIFLNRNNFYYMHIPSSILLKYRTRFFFFLSTNYNVLKVSVMNLLFLKEFVIYKLNGIYFKYQFILVKPGKNKFR